VSLSETEACGSGMWARAGGNGGNRASTNLNGQDKDSAADKPKVADLFNGWCLKVRHSTCLWGARVIGKNGCPLSTKQTKMWNGYLLMINIKYNILLNFVESDYSKRGDAIPRSSSTSKSRIPARSATSSWCLSRRYSVK
jgi:hypothetical protein